MLNIQRREPDPQELIAVARRYGTVMVARACADWSRQPEPFKGSLTAAMIDRVDCPAKQRDRIRMGTIHHPSGTPTGGLGSSYVAEQGSGASSRPWPSSGTGNSGPLPAIQSGAISNGWSSDNEPGVPFQQEIDGAVTNLLPEDEQPTEESYLPDFQQREPYRQSYPYQNSFAQSSPSGPLGQSNTGPLGYSSTPTQHTGNTGHMPAVSSGNSTIVQSTVVQSTVDLNMLMDIIETVFDRPTISTFVLMTGDKDFTRISARLKLRLNKTVIVVGIPGTITITVLFKRSFKRALIRVKSVIVVGIPGTVSRDLISSANQF